MLNPWESAIVRNAEWFLAIEDSHGRIRALADEYYGVPGDASLIGHAISVRMFAWILSGEQRYFDSALRSARWLAERQDARGGWHKDAGYSLDAAQCVMEGFCTYERLSGDRRFHEVLVRAADRMISGTVNPGGTLSIGNLTECGEYAHFAFMAWKQTGLERHRAGGMAILQAIMDSFDEQEGFWDTATDTRMHPLLELSKPFISPLMRASVAWMDLKGKTIAKISEFMLPLVTRGKGPQYGIGMMDAESLLDTLDGRLELPRLRRQTARAIAWMELNCAGPVAGSFKESRSVAKGRQVYPVKAINDAVNASLWPSAAYLLGLVGMNDAAYADRAHSTADWIVSMQDEDGGFLPHQDPAGKKYGKKYGNVNFYGCMALWHFNSVYVRKTEPSRAVATAV
ncbi:MAG TPA: prenyltransferase/squalene oxidase repeat-containing protein [Gammaproteobacteria bacterium]